MIEPLPIGTAFDDSTIVEVVQYDPSDDYQPFLYQLADGRTVWIPATEAQVKAEYSIIHVDSGELVKDGFDGETAAFDWLKAACESGAVEPRDINEYIIERAEPFDAAANYAGCNEIVPGVFISAGDAVYIADEQGEIVTWNADEVAEDGGAFTAALAAVALAAKLGPAAVRENIATGGKLLEKLILETEGRTR